MARFKCVESFDLEKYDEDCFPTDELVPVDVGSIWYEDTDCEYFMVAGDDAYRLINESDDSWIEIYGDRLEECFEKID